MSLPEGWVETTLGEVGKIVTGKTPKKKNPEFFDGEHPFVKPSDLDKDIFVTDTIETLSDSGLATVPNLPKGAVMVTCIGNMGKVGITGQVVATNQQINSIIPNENILDSKYLYYYVKTLKPWMDRESSATTISIINKSTFSKAPIILAPLKEQKQIAQKLEQVLARVERIKTALDNTPTTIKRFRQSVLALATSGGLSEDSLEWDLIKLENISKIIDPQPSHRTPKIDLNGIPYISTGDINEDGSINFEKARHVSYKVLEEHNQRYQLKKGDFIFGKIGTLGKATALPMGIDYTLSANIILIQPDIEKVVAKYLMFFLQSPITLKEISKQSNSTSQSAFGIKKMRSFSALFPPLQEQQKIVKKVETLFSLADNLEAKVNQAQKQVDRLTQSILAKAFRGEL